MMIQIYTDGAYLISKNIGGWAYVLINGDDKIQGYGSKHDTTNNQMEITALLEGLKALNNNFSDKSVQIEVISDSTYIINSASTWIDNWVRKRFKGKKNQDLWREFLELSKGWKITYTWVRGHSGDHYNEVCDDLASTAAAALIKK